MTINERRADLSKKLRDMGQALSDEGSTNRDVTVFHAGTALFLIGTILVNEDEMLLFNEVCAMFSAKKVLDSMAGYSTTSQIVERLRNRESNTTPVENKKTKRTRKPKDDSSNTE